MAREIFAKQDIMYVGRIHHGPNIIHSKKPIRSIEDFKDLKLRVPGGMIAEGFAAIGAKTTLLPGGEVFSALEKGTIEAADYTGPAVNWDLGFQQVTKYIWTGPVGLEFDLSAGRPDGLLRRHEPLEQAVAEDEGLGRARDRGLFGAASRGDPEGRHGSVAEVHQGRHPDQPSAGADLEKFQRVAVPIWFKWANKDKDAARVFKAQLEVMESPTFGYVTPDMYRARSSISERIERRRGSIRAAVRSQLDGRAPPIDVIVRHRCDAGNSGETDAQPSVCAAPLALLGHSGRLSAHRHVLRPAPAPARRSQGPVALHRLHVLALLRLHGPAPLLSRNNWGFVFIPVFLLILHTTDVIRDRREDVSRTRAAVGAARFRTRPCEDSARRDRDAADAGAPDQGRGRGTEGQIRFRGGASRPRRAGTATRAGSRS